MHICVHRAVFDAILFAHLDGQVLRFLVTSIKCVRKQRQTPVSFLAVDSNSLSFGKSHAYAAGDVLQLVSLVVLTIQDWIAVN